MLCQVSGTHEDAAAGRSAQQVDLGMNGVPLGGIADFDRAVTYAAPLRIAKVIPECERRVWVEEVKLLGDVAVRNPQDERHMLETVGDTEEKAWRRDVGDRDESVIHFGLEEGKKRTIGESSVPHDLAVLVDAGGVLTLAKQSIARFLCRCHTRLLSISLCRQSISRNRESSLLVQNELRVCCPCRCQS